MKRTQTFIGSLSVSLVAAVALGQTPTSEVDSHIATAKAAAGEDYRGTFVNLCLPSAPPGGRGAAGRGAGRGAAAPGATAAPATPDRAGWYASPYKVFDNLYWLGTRQHS